MLPEGYGECKICSTPCRGGYCSGCADSPVKCANCGYALYWDEPVQEVDGGFLCEDCALKQIQWIKFTPDYYFDNIFEESEG